MPRVLAALWLAVAGVLVGCGPRGDEVATATEPPQSPSSAAGATASAPPGFPDMSSYTEAAYDRYAVVDVPRMQGFSFTTTTGLHCSNNAYPTPDSEWVRCWGPRPDQGPGLWSIRAELNTPAVVERLTPNPDFETPYQSSSPVLPPSTRITALKGESTCGVGPDGTTACRIGQHGFVLTQSSVELF